MLLSNADSIYKGHISIVRAYLGTDLVYVKGETENTVPAYYVQQVEDALNYVQSLGTDDWVHHVAIADSHYDNNCRNSAPIVKYLMDTGNFDKFIHLGDITDNNNIKSVNNFLSDFSGLNGQSLIVWGNHDSQNPGTEGFGSPSMYYDTLMSENEGIVEFTEGSARDGLLYVYDDAENKFRYAIMDMDEYNHGTELVEFINQVFATIPDGWTLFLLSHQPKNEWAGDLPSAVFVNWILNDKIRFGATFNGHWHRCGHFNFLHMGKWICFERDGIYPNANSEDGIRVPNRTAALVSGTVNEQCVSILSIPKNGDTIKLYGIGAYLDEWKQYDAPMGDNRGAWVDAWPDADGRYTFYADDEGEESSGLATYTVPLQFEADASDVFWVYCNDFSDLAKVCVCLYGSKIRDSFNTRQTYTTTAQYGYIVPVMRSNASEPYGILSHVNATLVDKTVITREMPEIPFDKSLWASGSLTAAGATTANDSIYNCGRIFSVVPNGTYKFANSNAEWSSDWVAVCYWSEPRAAGFIKRETFGTASEFEFTVPENARYAMIASGNMADYIDTITLEKIEVVMYNVTQNFTNVTSDLASSVAREGKSLTVKLTADQAVLDTVTVAMGGTDITADVVSGYTITIPEVTGDVVITASATAIDTSYGWKLGGYYNNVGSIVASTTAMYYDTPIPVVEGEKFYFWNTDKECRKMNQRVFICWYDSSDKFKSRLSLQTTTPSHVLAGTKFMHTTVPAGAAYARLAFTWQEMLPYYKTYTWGNDVNALPTAWEDAVWFADQYWGGAGNLQNQANAAWCTAFKVTPGATYTVSNGGNCWMRISEWTALGSFKTNATGTGTVTFTIPADVNFISISGTVMIDYIDTVTVVQN